MCFILKVIPCKTQYRQKNWIEKYTAILNGLYINGQMNIYGQNAYLGLLAIHAAANLIFDTSGFPQPQ